MPEDNALGVNEVVEFWRFVDEKGVEYGQPLRIRYVYFASRASTD